MTKKEIIERLTEVKGVGPAKAEAIYNQGFNTIEKIAKASVEDLMNIKGVNETIAKDIIKYFTTLEKKPEKKSKEKPVEKKKIEKLERKEEKPSISSEETPVQSEYRVKKKPVLSDDMKREISIRKRIKQRTPRFLREEWFRYKRIPLNWRRPDGISSKMRRNFKYRPKRVKIGFRGPKKARGLHPSGFEEVLVYNVRDLEVLDPNTQAARIGSTVGTRKRMEIQQKAKELDIRILNG